MTDSLNFGRLRKTGPENISLMREKPSTRIILKLRAPIFLKEEGDPGA
ncbi:MAG: hypothetical protein OP8BY_2470 [Candidatus Saccharicenans subterraneus]|uniref:Uncharacterized protein n=1 Tax=Candidatus Saccharicenans subterraneus TaxID=2508984 RepID=A0A3E2BJ51_9BACT|nr:MAG: hypothetical protein OP8BY_2470 [Candidatus Saccharicenans subterraneum]